MTIGVLAIQGDFAAHASAIRDAGGNATEVRGASDLDALDGLIIPGGESTTMIKFIEEENLKGPLIEFAGRGCPIFGTCAGAILLAREVYNPTQASLGLIDIAVERNAYGRQVDSFIGQVDTTLTGTPIEAVFIRAPKITEIGPEVEALASLRGEPVLVRCGDVMAATFHPELTDDRRVHLLFLEMVQASIAERMAATTAR